MARPAWQKPLARGIMNRFLHVLARIAPGGRTLRPLLHRIRGVTVHPRVWIGDDVYLENEYPEEVEIHEGAVISMRCTIVAHTNGKGKIVIERDAFIGPGCIIICQQDKVIRIGRGAVLGPGCVVTSSVATQAFVLHPRCSAVATATVPLTTAATTGASTKDFMAGLKPLKRRKIDSSQR